MLIKDILIPGKTPTKWSDDTMLIVETQDSNKFTRPNINFLKPDL